MKWDINHMTIYFIRHTISFDSDFFHIILGEKWILANLFHAKGGRSACLFAIWLNGG